MNESFRNSLRQKLARRGFLQNRLTVQALEERTVPSVAGTVFQDYNANGVQDSREPGVPNVTVTAYDSTNAVLGTTTTLADGTYTLGFATVSGRSVRVDFTGLPSYLQSGAVPATSATGTSDQFVTDGATANLTVNNPSDYSQANPNTAFQIYKLGNQLNGPAATTPVLLSAPYNATGVAGQPNGTAYTPLANANQVGTTFGLAYQSTSNTVFAAAFEKRYSGFGPTGTGGIYAINATTGAVDNIYTVPNAGTDTHPADLTFDQAWSNDVNSFAAVGKVSLGGLALSEDGSVLYAVNLATKELDEIPLLANGTLDTSRKTIIHSIPNPNAGLSAARQDDIRPFAVAVKNGIVYIGMVDSAESTQDAADLFAYVYSFNPVNQSFSAAPVLKTALNYNRGFINNAGAGSAGGISGNWNPWISTYPTGANAPTNANYPSYPQPLLTGITFDNGSLVLGIRDRWGDQTGYSSNAFPTYLPTTGNTTEISGIAGGDVLRATPTGTGTFTIESDLTYGNAPSQPISRFYTGNDRPGYHDDVSDGGVAQVPGFGTVLETAFDPNPMGELFAGGTKALSDTDGTATNYYQVYNGGSNATFGKADGIGNIVALSNPAPLEIGNRVFNDVNGDGIQEAGEAGVDGVAVQLVQGGIVVQTVVTSNGGLYYFANVTPNTQYQVRIDPNQNALTSLGLTQLSPYEAGSNRSIDSKGQLYGGVAYYSQTSGNGTYTTGAAGDNDYTLDFGFTAPPLSNVSVTKVSDAQTVTAGQQIGFTVKLTNTGSGTATGVTLADTLPLLGGTNVWTIDPNTGNPSAFSLSQNSAGQQLTLSGSPTLAPGASLTVHVIGTSTPSNTPFTAAENNTATVNATNETTHNQAASASVTVLSPAVTVTKTADSQTASSGQTVGFTIAIKNIGLGTANGVTMTDDLPALGGSNLWSIDPTSANANQFTITGAAGSQVLSLTGTSTLAAGATLTVHFTGTVATGVSTVPNTATIDATNEVLAYQNQASTAVVTVQSPDVTVTKRADQATVAAGQQDGFTVTLANTGSGNATGVTLSDPLPALGGTNLWSIDPLSANGSAFTLSGAAGQQVLTLTGTPGLAAGASLSVHLLGTTTPSAATPFTATVSNTATVSANNEPSSLQNQTSTAAFVVDSPDVTVAKTADAATVSAGQTAGFTITLHNIGAGNAQSVVLSDPLPPLGGNNLWSIDTASPNASAFSLTGPAGGQVLSLVGTPSLAAGASLVVHITGTSTAADASLPNTATVSASNEAPALQNQHSTATVTVQSASVVVVKQADQPTVAAGQQDGFTVSITNGGAGIANGVTLSDPLPALGGSNLWSIDPASANAGSFVLSGPAGQQTLTLAGSPSLAAGATLAVHIVGTTTPSANATFTATVSNTATVSAANEPPAQQNQTSTASFVVDSPNVAVTKVSDAGTVNAGQQIGYTVKLTNTGAGTAAGVTLADTLPLLGGTNVWTIDPNSANASSFALSQNSGGQQLTLVGSPSLAAGASLTVHVVGTSTPSDTPFTASENNTATVDASNESTHNQAASASVTVLSPAVTVTKTADAANVSPGQTAGFTIAIKNIGLGTANGVTMTDSLPALGGSNLWSIDPTSANANQFTLTGAAGSQVLSLTGTSTLAAGATLTVHFTGTVAPGVSTVPNTAMIDASNEVLAYQNQASTAVVTVQSPDVTVSKRADQASVTAGQQDGFTVTVSNTGAGNATGVTLSDPLPALGGTNLWSIDPLSANGSAFTLSGAAGQQVLTLTGTPGLAAGASLSVHLLGTTTPSAATPFTATVSNTATVSANNEPSSLQNQTSTAAFVVDSPDVTVAKTADAATVSAGQTAGFTITLHNIGAGNAQSVVLSDPLPPLGGNNLWSIDTASPNASAFSLTGPAGGQVLSLVGTPSLAAGASLVVHITGTSTSSATGLSNTATVTATNEAASLQNQHSTATIGVSTFSIGDFVFNDANNDGTADNGEKGIAGVTVNLYATANGQATGSPIASTTTNSQGYYLFTGLAQGSYVVEVVTPTGYTSSTGTVDSATGPFEPAPNTLTDNNDHGTIYSSTAVRSGVITLTPGGEPTTTPATPGITDTTPAGNRDSTVDFGFFQPLSIGDYVYNDPTNSGVAANATSGIANATVNLYSVTNGQASASPIATTKTNSQGYYLFDYLPAGTYQVEVVNPAGYVSSSGTNGSSSGPYEPATGVSADNADHGTRSSPTATRSADIVLSPGTEPTNTPATPGIPDPTPSGNRNSTIDFGFYQPASIGNFVFSDTNGNGIEDPGEAGVAGVKVELLSGTTVVSTATTDSSGAYLFTNLSAGAYTVEFVPSTLPANTLFTLPNVGTNTAVNSKANVSTGVTGVINLTAGQAYADADAGLIAAASVSGQVFVDTNQNGALDPGEPAIPNTTITLTGTSDTGSAVSLTTTTNASGQYQFLDLRPGTYTVHETQPTGYSNGPTIVGSAGGTHGSDTVSSIVLAAGVAGTGYNFGEGGSVTDIAVVQTASATTATVGQNVVLTFKVTNDSGTDAANTILSTPLPAGLTFVNQVGSPTQGSFNSSSNIWSLGTLTAGSTATLQITVRVASAGTFTNTAVVSTSNPETTLTNNSSPITITVTGTGQVAGGGSKQNFLSQLPAGSTASAPNLQPTTTTAPPANSTDIIVTGTGYGSAPLVQVFDRTTGAQRLSFYAFDPSFLGGITVALGDITGTGTTDIIVGAGVGGQGHVEVFDGTTGALIRSFLAYPNYNGAITVAAADVQGTGRADIITGSGSGTAGNVKVFDAGTAGTPTLISSFYAYDQGYLGGVNVAGGDITGTGKAAVITGAAASVTHVKAFTINADGSATTIESFIAFAGSNSGVTVAAGNTSGGTTDNIIAGVTAGPSQVSIFTGGTGALIRSFTAFAGSTNGVTVAAADANGDSRADVIAGGGAGDTPQVSVFDSATGNLYDNFLAYNSTYKGGVKLAAFTLP